MTKPTSLKRTYSLNNDTPLACFPTALDRMGVDHFEDDRFVVILKLDGQVGPGIGDELSFPVDSRIWPRCVLTTASSQEAIPSSYSVKSQGTEAHLTPTGYWVPSL